VTPGVPISPHRVAPHRIYAVPRQAPGLLGVAPRLHVARMLNIARALLRDESGQGLTEYAIIVGTIAFAAIVAFIALGGRLQGIFSSVQTQLNTVPTS
jgi:Flp pilus assembly pilin Flp